MTLLALELQNKTRAVRPNRKFQHEYVVLYRWDDLRLNYPNDRIIFLI